MDGSISGPDDILVENSFAYPFGTTEQFPRMQNSDLAEIENSAHYYMECSNKGTCNRQTGTCECLDGYDGAACQRASCPGYPKSCSGHGVCKTIRQLAQSDYENIYELWDKDSTMGCECDAGFFGADCSLRECKYGIDPLYLDDSSTIKYSIFNFAVLATGGSSDFKDSHLTAAGHINDGSWQIRFFDRFGEDWYTTPLVAGATCAQVVDAINALPNDVVPGTMAYSQCKMVSKDGSTAADFKDDFAITDSEDKVLTTIPNNIFFWIDGDKDSPDGLAYMLSGHLYRIHFDQNPGKLREPEINIYLDGKRPSLAMPDEQIITKVWTDGNQGEDVDYFADHCDGVTVTIDNSNDPNVLVMSAAQKLLLKACLGDADFSYNNNEDVYDWDYGSEDFPHLIKLVLTTGTMSDGGHYAGLIYDQPNDDFLLMQPMLTEDETDVYEVYTTKGTFARVSNRTRVAVDFASNEYYLVSSDALKYGPGATDEFWDGDVSCETYDTYFVSFCLNKTDLITFIDPDTSTNNPHRINLYTVEKLYKQQYNTTTYSTLSTPDDNFFGMQSNVIVTDLSANFGYGLGDKGKKFQVYKFFPSAESSYNYVAQCSNRGLCNEAEGLCECFGGYTGDSCSDQNSLAV